MNNQKTAFIYIRKQNKLISPTGKIFEVQPNGFSPTDSRIPIWIAEKLASQIVEDVA